MKKYKVTRLKNVLLLLIALFCCSGVFAQAGTAGVEMADAMRSSGKIYVVIATIAIVFVGLAIYLFMIDSRLRKLEK